MINQFELNVHLYGLHIVFDLSYYLHVLKNTNKFMKKKKKIVPVGIQN